MKASSVAISASAKAVRIIHGASIPGAPNHSAAVKITCTMDSAAIHGLRGPDTSAIAPTTGASTAIAMPASAIM